MGAKAWPWQRGGCEAAKLALFRASWLLQPAQAREVCQGAQVSRPCCQAPLVPASVLTSAQCLFLPRVQPTQQSGNKAQFSNHCSTQLFPWLLFGPHGLLPSFSGPLEWVPIPPHSGYRIDFIRARQSLLSDYKDPRSDLAFQTLLMALHENRLLLAEISSSER